MRCLECDLELERLDTHHLLACSGLTLQEYALRHHQPLELLLSPGQLAADDDPAAYPPPAAVPRESARALLRGLRWAGRVRERDGFTEIGGEVRRLDLLLWTLEQLHDYGFRFHQDYRYTDETHRVVAHNRLRVPSGHLARPGVRPAVEPPPDFLDSLAACLAQVGELHAGYLFMPFADAGAAADVATTLRRDHAIGCRPLALAEAGGRLLRSETLDDAVRLLALLRERLQAMPGAWERFHAETPHATVTKELVFDSAHFITDHPAKCSNLHGGRYLLQVAVRGRIDPVTGCVVDYGYLKRVVNRLVVERFDHHSLNYAAPELAWRSSTEMLCVFIWERLIDYLPGLASLRLYETSQSWCDYQGPSLDAFQRRGADPILRPFDAIDAAARRRVLGAKAPTALRAVAGSSG